MKKVSIDMKGIARHLLDRLDLDGLPVECIDVMITLNDGSKFGAVVELEDEDYTEESEDDEYGDEPADEVGLRYDRVKKFRMD